MFYIQATHEQNNMSHTLSLSYDTTTRKKVFLLNGKKTTKKNIKQFSPILSVFIPLMMNLFYLGPKYRRDFLDDLLKNTFPEYEDILQKYEKIVKHRNKILKNISE